MSDPNALRWRKSTFSANDSNCVELAWPAPQAAIRDSKSPTAGILAAPTPALKHLLSLAKHR